MLLAPHWIILSALLVAAGLMMLLERRGLRTTLALQVKGDVKRETRWLAQYGQAVCTVVAALLVLQLDARHADFLPVLAAPFLAGFVAIVIKRLVSRVRPGREGAGRFLGPHWSHANFRESFPSSHSASAIALSGILATLFPHAAITFWALAIVCAVLRYVLDAHWPSDVLGGIALGYATALLVAWIFHIPA